jgi:hypothetical protein
MEAHQQVDRIRNTFFSSPIALNSGATTACLLCGDALLKLARLHGVETTKLFRRPEIHFNADGRARMRAMLCNLEADVQSLPRLPGDSTVREKALTKLSQYREALAVDA